MRVTGAPNVMGDRPYAQHREGMLFDYYRLTAPESVSAAARKECRGAHTVYDYERPADDPECPLGRNDKEWLKHTLWHSATNSLTYKPVNLKPLTVDSVPPKVRTF